MGFDGNEQIGWMTLYQICSKISSNNTLAASLKLRLSWGYSGEKIFGRIWQGDHMIYEKYYHGNLLPWHIAELQCDFSVELLKHEKIKRNGIIAKERQSQFKKIEEMPTWAERLELEKIKEEQERQRNQDLNEQANM